MATEKKSADSAASENKSAATSTPKSKGPIRVEAIFPFGILVACVGLYFSLFFDGHLRRGIEWAATQGNGAEVNVGGLKTSFLEASFQMTAIEFTDPSQPVRNRLQVGRVDFKVLWDALLRGKFVIDLAGVNGVEVQTPRKSPGFVVPPSKSDTTSKVMGLLKEKLAATSIGEVARMLEGFDPTKELKDLGNLKAVQQVNALRSEISTKEKEWATALQALPGEKDLNEIRQRLNSIRIGGNPIELQGQIKQVESVISSVQTQVDSVRTKGEQISGDVNKFQASVGQVDDLAKKDREDLESRLKLPKIDPKTIAQQMFGSMVAAKYAQAHRYMDMARKYMPPQKKESGKPAALVHARAKGRTYEFGRPNSYPLFWLKKATFSSNTENTEFGGIVSGQLTNVSSSPAQVSAPVQLSLRGSFPKRKIEGVNLTAEVDATGERFAARLHAGVEQFPMDSYSLSESEKLKFAIAEAIGQMSLDGQYSDEGVRFGIKGAFKDVKYDVASSSKLLEQIVRGVVSGVPLVTLGATVSGKILDPEISIESNLAEALGSGLARQLQAQLAEARKKIEALIQAQIGAKKAELQKQVDQAKAMVTARIEQARKQAEALQVEARSRISQAQNQAASAVKKQGIDALRKKLPF